MSAGIQLVILSVILLIDENFVCNYSYIIWQTAKITVIMVILSANLLDLYCA